MIKSNPRRKFELCTGTCGGQARGNYCVKCDQGVCRDCAAAHIAGHREADKAAALAPIV